ncbi:unnamed protein product [Closterium sp. NIES-53]
MVREYGLQQRIMMGAVPPEANREVLRLKPKCVPATPDINSMILMYICYVVGILWLIPMRHEIVGTTAYRWGYKVTTAKTGDQKCISTISPLLLFCSCVFLPFLLYDPSPALSLTLALPLPNPSTHAAVGVGVWRLPRPQGGTGEAWEGQVGHGGGGAWGGAGKA